MDWVVEHNGVPIWASNDPDPSYAIIQPILDWNLNAAGEFSFKIPVTHPAFNTIGDGRSWVLIRRDGVPFWRGRAFKVGTPLSGVQEVTVAGALSVFSDTDAGPWRLTNVSPEGLLRRIVADHNTQATFGGQPDADRQFTVGVVSAWDGSVYERSIAARPLPSSWEALESRTFGSGIGGYLTLTGAGLNIINWQDSSGVPSSQIISYGENLLSMHHVRESLEVVTAVEPFGAELTPGEGDYLTLDNTVNGAVALYTDAGGVVHYGVADTALEATFGRRKTSTISDSVKVKETLLRHANESLASRKLVSVTINASTLDLATINFDMEALELGQLVTVRVPHLGIEEQMQVTAGVYTLDDVSSWRFTLGVNKRARAQEARRQANTISEFVSSNYTIGEAVRGVRETVDAVGVTAANAASVANQALVNVGAALMSTDDLVRDPVFASGADGYTPAVTLNSVPPSSKPLPAGFTSSGLTGVETAHYFGTSRVVLPGHTYRFSAWVVPESLPATGGSGQPSEPSWRFGFGATPSNTYSPWLPITIDMFTYVEWDWFCPLDGSIQSIQPVLDTTSTDAAWYVTGFHIKDITVAAQTAEALAALNSDYSTFVNQTLTSLIEQNSSEIMLQVGNEYVASNEFATRWASEMSTFTVDGSSIQMLFQQQDALQTTVNGVTQWQADASNWINFSSTGIDMGQSTSTYRIHIDSDDITFYEGDLVLAQFSNQQLTANGIVATDRLRYGPFEWRPGSRASLWNLVKV